MGSLIVLHRHRTQSSPIRSARPTSSRSANHELIAIATATTARSPTGDHGDRGPVDLEDDRRAGRAERGEVEPRRDAARRAPSPSADADHEREDQRQALLHERQQADLPVGQAERPQEATSRERRARGGRRRRRPPAPHRPPRREGRRRTRRRPRRRAARRASPRSCVVARRRRPSPRSRRPPRAGPRRARRGRARNRPTGGAGCRREPAAIESNGATTNGRWPASPGSVEPLDDPERHRPALDLELERVAVGERRAPERQLRRHDGRDRVRPRCRHRARGRAANHDAGRARRRTRPGPRRRPPVDGEQRGRGRVARERSTAARRSTVMPRAPPPRCRQRPADRGSGSSGPPDADSIR